MTAKRSGPTPVEAIIHPDKRSNLPTADAHDLVPPEVEELVPVSYPRELHSPMLVWEGKEALDQSDLEVDAPPIYIQEKIDPRVLVENLRRTAQAEEQEPELSLFASFDGLSELDLVEFYRHEANWSNRMILGDSLQVMASLAERERLRGKVQMIYLDPPYGIKFGSNWQVSARNRDVKDGKLEDIAREAEQIKAFRDTWELGINSYLTYLRDRLHVARDLLTASGTIFVQIGDENVHLIRGLLDEIFGSENFVSLIPFATTSGAGSFAVGTNLLASVVNYVVVYARDIELVKYRQLFRPKEVGGDAASLYTRVLLADGTTRPLSSSERKGSPLPDGARAFGVDNLTSQTTRVGQTTVFPVEINGRTISPRTGGWKTNRQGMDRLLLANRVHIGDGKNLGYIRYIDDFPASPVSNLWTDTLGQGQFGGDKLYVVQTANKVVERCMLMSTDPGDLVIDPTCGSGTTAFVAEQWGRRWITIDTSRVALALARQRLMGAKFPFYLLADSVEGRRKESELSPTPLPPATPTSDIRHGFVCERIRHVTLKSIANNPDLREGMSRDEIDRTIKRHAEFEVLYDKPFEDEHVVRVTGPFSVESLSPHRSLAGMRTDEPVSATRAAEEPGAPTFEQTILDNLKVAGVQNGKRHERLTFDSVEPYAANYIQAVGVREDSTDTAPKRVGISIGPQYGTVAPGFVKSAAREATKATDLDLLCVLGFAFDPQVLNTGQDFVATDESFDVAAERSLGRIPVLLVRMNADLLMGEELKKTGAGNLFTVFGEPDIAITIEGDEVRAELLGVDVFDPTTAEIRSDSTDRVALWMIDTDYDGESFFVRHCYFTGGQDPYVRLKKALKADIDEEAWATLNQTVSRPFPKPSTGRIAIKVINDYGDEVVKVYDL
ncbi:MAG TPA: site-specific DNA-methyltransferase [Candidatus Solibacter sp.]|jgi:adenine-specific DNA-methyltransferase|nr:site-specific DNA-methyltransferase [Candidatus Solibacter sp.]